MRNALELVLPSICMDKVKQASNPQVNTSTRANTTQKQRNRLPELIEERCQSLALCVASVMERHRERWPESRTKKAEIRKMSTEFRGCRTTWTT